MIFTTTIAGVPCKCEVTMEPKAAQMRILDRNGIPAPWLAQQMTQADDIRLWEEFHLERQGERYGYL